MLAVASISVTVLESCPPFSLLPPAKQGDEMRLFWRLCLVLRCVEGSARANWRAAGI